MSNLDLDSLPKKGESVLFLHKGVTFPMTVTNARIRYGQVDVQVTPVLGEGSMWVTYNSVKIANTDNAPNVVEKALNS